MLTTEEVKFNKMEAIAFPKRCANSETKITSKHKYVLITESQNFEDRTGKELVLDEFENPISITVSFFK